MSTIVIEDLPEPAARVLRRRAQAAGLSAAAYLRVALAELANTRIPLDDVVAFLHAELPNPAVAEIDSDATALIHDLPEDAARTFTRRAGAAGVPLSTYLRQELTTLGRRTTIDDVILEFREAQDHDPNLLVDMDAVIAAARYARAE
ncbi:hypothetical protein [Nocardia macrotermitis]|uniref:Uncharacterized protein n=1 Tax=Nocardia macrotermitis TaxID=2585198 RepID=A0A7K0D412_9NOCA|nr:hypothetical protein [Nocardia macrotermitis]MQY20427.1 hypothetical protein [Nocardia macrotermitis]